MSRGIDLETACTLGVELSRPTFAIIGGFSGQAGGTPLKNAEDIRRACEEIGREAAAAGADLVVCPDEPGTIDAHIVRGYTSRAGRDGGGRVTIAGRSDPQAGHGWPDAKQQVVTRIDLPAEGWRYSACATALASDGIVLIGNGALVEPIGAAAAATGRSLLPLPTFGGAAAVVWQAVRREAAEPAATALDVMNRPWRKTTAAELIDLLVSQHAVVEQHRRLHRRASTSAAIGTALRYTTTFILLACAVMSIPLSMLKVSPALAVSMLLFGPLLAATAGGLIRPTLVKEQESWRAAVHGFVAGVISVLLYVGTQLLTTPDLFDAPVRARLFVIVVLIGLAAGVTADLVLAGIRRVNAVNMADLRKEVQGSASRGGAEDPVGR